MLRITAIENGDTTTYRLEGRLTGDWVREFERCWVAAKDTHPGTRFKVDLTDVEFVDQEGEALLGRMLAEGVEFDPGNLFMTSIMSVIQDRARAERPKCSTQVQ